jgi:hypothetical protein
MISRASPRPAAGSMAARKRRSRSSNRVVSAAARAELSIRRRACILTVIPERASPTRQVRPPTSPRRTRSSVAFDASIDATAAGWTRRRSQRPGRTTTPPRRRLRATRRSRSRTSQTSWTPGSPPRSAAITARRGARRSSSRRPGDAAGPRYGRQPARHRRGPEQHGGRDVDAYEVLGPLPAAGSQSKQRWCMSRVERDPERGRAAAAKLKKLGVKGILIKAAEQGYITQVACKMPECN